MKEVITILQITKQKAKYLLANGVKFGENGLTTTKPGHNQSKRKTFYVCESKRNIQLLNAYEKR